MLPTLALVVLLPTAPVPRDFNDRSKIEARYGKVVDPKGDSTFKLDGDKLVVALPANETRDLCRRVDSAPKLVREVEGDFELVIGITAELPKGAKAIHRSGCAFLGGGVKLDGREKNRWVRYGCAHTIPKRGEELLWLPHENAPLRTTAHGVEDGDRMNGAKPGETIHLRFIRRGTLLTIDGRGKVSDGGWFGIRSDWEYAPKGPLTVSLFAHHSSDKGGTVTFSDFKITPLPKVEK